MLGRCTEDLQFVIAQSKGVAVELDHPAIGTEHLLMSLSRAAETIEFGQSKNQRFRAIGEPFEWISKTLSEVGLAVDMIQLEARALSREQASPSGDFTVNSKALLRNLGLKSARAIYLSDLVLELLDIRASNASLIMDRLSVSRKRLAMTLADMPREAVRNDPNTDILQAHYRSSQDFEGSLAAWPISVDCEVVIKTSDGLDSKAPHDSEARPVDE